MRFSIFTPTHHTRYLDRLAKSLSRQTFSDFEWVLVSNGANPPSVEEIQAIGKNYNLNVKVVSFNNTDVDSIGYLKLFACQNSSGEILVEVDHDDQLTPDALEELDKAFTEDIHFVYSNFANFTQSGSPFRYDSNYQWQYRDFLWEGKICDEVVCFPPTATMMSRIHFQPNHIRAWRRDFYFKIGGHHPRLDVLDDQDIISRSYIHGNVKHIDKCLYIYHIHDLAVPGEGNSCYSSKNSRIQEEMWWYFDKYIYALAEKEADLRGLRKIDCGAAFDKAKGYESIDLEPSQAGDPDPDIIGNLNEVWPFESNSVGVLRMHDILEHLKSPIHVMKEAYRVLAPGGYMLIMVPSTDGRGWAMDPTHRDGSQWNSNSFFYYTKRSSSRYIKTPVRFQELRIKNFYPSDWHKLHDILYTFAVLMKLPSECRTPGLVQI